LAGFNGSSISLSIRRRSVKAGALVATALVIASQVRHACADVTETWNFNGSGNWATAADWSGGTNFPNNGTPAGTNYEADVTLAENNPYTVSVNDNIVVDELTIGSFNATVDAESGGTLTLGALNVNSGTLDLGGGSLDAANNASSYAVGTNGELEVVNGTIVGGTLNSTGTISANNATFNGVTIGAGTNVSVLANDQLTLTGSWLNQGTITGTSGIVELEGTFAPSAIGSISSYVTYVMGTLNIGPGNTFTLNSHTGPLYLYGGEIPGGTLAASGGENWTFEYGILTNVTLNAIDPETFDGTYMTVRSGLSGTGQDFTMNGGTLVFDGPSQQINNLEISNGAGESLPVLIYAGGPTSIGATTLTIASNSTISSADGQMRIVPYANSGDSVVNNGTMIATGNILSIAGIGNPNMTFTNNGLINVVANGEFLMEETAWTNSSTGTISVGKNAFMTVYSSGTNSGAIKLSGGTIYALSGLNVGEGALSGSGTINGALTLDSDPSNLAFNIGGTAMGTGYDSLTVNGNVNLGGDLEISFVNGFQNLVTFSEQFEVLTTGSNDVISGSFLNVLNGGRLETTDGYGSFLVNYDVGQANEIVLSDFEATVPEPASSAILCISFIALAGRRSRPNRQEFSKTTLVCDFENDLQALYQ